MIQLTFAYFSFTAGALTGAILQSTCTPNRGRRKEIDELWLWTKSEVRSRCLYCVCVKTTSRVNEVTRAYLLSVGRWKGRHWKLREHPIIDIDMTTRIQLGANEIRVTTKEMDEVAEQPTFGCQSLTSIYVMSTPISVSLR